jgi:glycosyltransferase involved in cell wall biosynthesis
MKILIVSTVVPFIEGGGTFIVDWLDHNFKKFGYESEVIKIPFNSDPSIMLEQMLSLRLLDVTEYADRLVAIRTPSYLMRHPNKVLWFIHHHRGAYDLWDTPYQNIPNSVEGYKLRNSIIEADNLSFRESKKIYTNSKVVSERLKIFNQVNSDVLYPPLNNSEKYYSSGSGDYILYVSRLTHVKRQHLAVEAMRYTKTKVKLIIAGKTDTEQYYKYLISIVSKYNLQGKVEIIERWISDVEKVKMFADCLASVYIPFDEDSYGYPSLESFHSRKPVVTCYDSGGTLEIVEDGENGFISESDPVMIAETFDRLYSNKQKAASMGVYGLESLTKLDITWDNVVRRLTE